MSGEKTSTIDVQGVSIPFLSPGMQILIPLDSGEFEMSRNATDTLIAGVF